MGWKMKMKKISLSSVNNVTAANYKVPNAAVKRLWIHRPGEFCEGEKKSNQIKMTVDPILEFQP